MKKTPTKLLKILLTLLPVVAAMLAVAYLVIHRPGPTQIRESESVRPLRVLRAPAVDLIPRVTGYGVAQPGRIWDAVAEVKGTVAAVHPRLKSGELIAADTPLIHIDPMEYELAAARLEATVEETRAKVKELAEVEANTRALLAVEKRSLALALKSLERKRAMLKRNVMSQDEIDREERNFLQQKQQLQQLENTLSLIPSKRKALDAALAVHQAHQKQARIDLTKTTLKAPFDCRLGDVNIEAGQFVRAGQSLFSAHGTAVAEVEARFGVEELRHLLSQPKQKAFQPGLSTGAFQGIFDEVRVRVTLQSGDWLAEWDGRIDGLRGAVDLKTREIKVVAAVDRPYDKAVPGVRPPLTAGMFCKVELLGPVRPGSVVVPRSAIHNNAVFVVDEEDRLQKQQVVVDFAQADAVVIRSGLSAGETVVVSDPSPAIIGMKVLPMEDDGLRQHLLDLTQGKMEAP